MPIIIEAQGDEIGVQFSLEFNISQLSFVQAEVGNDARDNRDFVTNSTLLGQGRVGVALFLRQALARGQREVAVMRFRLSNSMTAGQSVALNFSDMPTRRSVVDNDARRLDAAFANGAVTAASGFEGDVNGDGDIDLVDAQLIINHVAGRRLIAAGPEFQRADCAPREGKGDGFIEVGDAQLVVRFLATNERIPAGGPSAQANLVATSFQQLLSAALKPRWLPERSFRIEPEKNGERRFSNLLLEARGGESAFSFSLRFDPARVRFDGAAAGDDAPDAKLIVNATELAQGRVGIALLLPSGQRFFAGTHRAIKLAFSAVGEADGVTTSLEFVDQPVTRRVVNEEAESLVAEFISARTTLRSGGAVLLSAGDYSFDMLAADSAVASFGGGLAIATQSASSEEPPLLLAGTTVIVRDQAGFERFAPLLFVSPEQVNFRIPAGTASGPATVLIIGGDGRRSIGLLHVSGAKQNAQ